MKNNNEKKSENKKEIIRTIIIIVAIVIVGGVIFANIFQSSKYKVTSNPTNVRKYSPDELRKHFVGREIE